MVASLLLISLLHSSLLYGSSDKDGVLLVSCGEQTIDKIRASNVRCRLPGYPEEERSHVALEALTSCAHAAARGGDAAAWPRLLARLALSPADLVSRHAAALLARYVDHFTPGEVRRRTASLCVTDRTRY